MKNLGISVAVAALVWLLPAPAGVTAQARGSGQGVPLPTLTPTRPPRPPTSHPTTLPQAWHLLAIFLGTIVGIITKPMPLGAVAMLGLGASMLTNTLTFPAAFSAFASEIPWLIAIAFWLSGGFIKSGLGSRIAYGIVSLFGSTTLGLTYSLVFAEALLAPAIPSVAARAGGIFFPLAKALCLACGSDPKQGTQDKMGAYVMKTLFQVWLFRLGD